MVSWVFVLKLRDFFKPGSWEKENRAIYNIEYPIMKEGILSV